MLSYANSHVHVPRFKLGKQWTITMRCTTSVLTTNTQLALLKNEKRSLRRKCQKHFKVEKGVLYYRSSDELLQWRHVPRDSEHIRRILESCHSSLSKPVGGHLRLPRRLLNDSTGKIFGVISESLCSTVTPVSIPMMQNFKSKVHHSTQFLLNPRFGIRCTCDMASMLRHNRLMYTG